MLAFQKALRPLAVLALALPLAAFAAEPITGTVTNKTTGKPAAGDDVTLIRLSQGMQESTKTKTDARGHFSLAVPDEGVHLVRVTHDKANYFRPAPPGTQSVEIDVYTAAEKVEGVSTAVQEYHVEATATELHIVEVLQVLNHSQPARTQFGPAGYDFYLPEGAVVQRAGAVTENGMPVQTAAVPVGDPNHYKFLFPIRPGETQFGIIFSLPYSGSYKFSPKLGSPISTLAVVLPKSIKFKADPSAPFAIAPATSAGTDTWMASNVSPSQPLDFTISGQGELPRDADKSGQQSGDQGAPVAATDNKAPGKGLDNPLDPEGNRDPWGKYKYWILAGLAILLAAAAAFLLRKPSAPADPMVGLEPAHPFTPSHHVTAAAPASSLDALKEELFALETDHLQNRITEAEYQQHKAALELILRRALTRKGQES